jgi:protein-S-isoprenylcysteine O-methyltransferase Ste14
MGDLTFTVTMVWLYTLGFALLHSLAAANAVKQRFYARGWQIHHYRLLYSLVGVISTLIWLGLIHALADSSLYAVDGVAKYGFYALQALGIGIAVSALLPIDGAVFLGLKKAEKQVDPFVVRGIYQYIRHPMYAGAMLYLLAKPEQTVVSLHFALAVSLYFILGSKLEERRMLAENPEYADYQQQVGAFMPKWFK